MTQSTQPSTQFSPSNWAVNATEQYLTIQEGDNIFKKGGKCITRAVADSALTVAALVETVVLAAVTAVTSPLYVFAKTAPVVKSLAGRTTLAASAAKNAAKGIVGFSSIKAEPKVEPKVATLFEKLQAKASAALAYTKEKATPAINYVYQHSSKTRVAYTVGAAAVLVGGYIYGGTLAGLAKSGLAAAGNGLYSLGKNYSPNFLKVGFHKVFG